MRGNRRTPITAFLLFGAAVSCTAGEPELDFDLTESGVAPAGSNAAPVSNNIPLTVAPGERLNVQTTMRNTGTNTWNGSFYFRRTGASIWSFTLDQVTGTVPANTNEDFDFIITTPAAPGSYAFNGSMYSAVAGQTGFFGTALSIPAIVVDAGQARRWACTFEPAMSTLPGTIFATESRSVTIVVRNTGTGTWQFNNPQHYLYSRDDLGEGDIDFWGGGARQIPLTGDVAPGATASFTFDITAPATPGSYQFLRQMFQTGQPTPNGGIGFFDLVNHCVDQTITVQASPPFRDATVIAQDFPGSFAPDEPRLVRVQMRNDGVETWVPFDYALNSGSTPASLWGATIAHGDANVTTGNVEDYVLVVQAPTAPGAYAHQWQMFKFINPGTGFFGEAINVPATVNAGQAPFYTAAFVSQTIPTRITAGSTVTFSITMQNNGNGPWDHEYFLLRSRSVPSSLWGTIAVALTPGETVPVGGQRTFTFDAVAPATAGFYDSQWAMALAQGPAYFFLDSDDALQQNIEVTLCGNGVLDAGESCDDGNLTDGDGCSSLCGGIVIDLATDTAGRTLVGSTDLKQLGNVVIADVTGDGVNDVMGGEMAHVYPMGENGRSRAGIVNGYLGGAAFLDGSTTTVPTGAAFQIWGASDNDRLGASNLGGLEVGDVTGDGVADLVVSSWFADGPTDGRIDCGEAYVIQGGAALATAGVIDLGALVPSPLVVATIIGPSAGAGLTVNALADLTGDGVLDLILGSSGDDTAGADAGAVRIVPGGAGLTGTIDLASGGAIATVLGASAGDALGRFSAAGNVGGSAAADLIVSSTTHTRLGINNGGGVWVLFGPLAGTFQLGSGDFDVEFLGGLNERYGASMRVANVTGDANNELLIGANQTRNTLGVQTGSTDIWQGPFATGTSVDLSIGDLPDTRITAPDFADNTGRSVATGDMNNDGYDEISIVMSAADGPANARNNCGELGVIRGTAVLPASINLGTNPPELRIYGAADRDYLGNQPRFLAFGDIDGDSRADLCVGSQNGGSFSGMNAPGRIDCFSSVF